MKTVLRKTKRFFAMFLALALIVLAVPDTALFAAEGDRYSLNEETGEYVADENGAYVEDAEGNIVEAAETAEPSAEPEEPEEPETPEEPAEEENTDVVLSSAIAGAGDEITVDNNALGASPYTVSVSATGADVALTGVAIGSSTLWDGTSDITITVTPDEANGYTLEGTEVTYRIGNNGTETLELSDAGVATIDCDTEERSVTINGNVKITVKAALVTKEVTVSEISGWKDVEDAGVVVGYEPDDEPDPTVAVVTPAVLSATYGTKLTFKVALGDEYKDSHEIRGVSYYVGTVPEKFVSDEDEPVYFSNVSKTGGSFSIPADALKNVTKFGEAVTIFVETGKKSYAATVSGDKGYDTTSTIPVLEGGTGFAFQPDTLPGYTVKDIKAYKSSSMTTANLIDSTFADGKITIAAAKVTGNTWIKVTTTPASYEVEDGGDDVLVYDSEDLETGKVLLTPKTGFTPVPEGEVGEEELAGYELTYKTNATFKLTPYPGEAGDGAEIVTGVTYTPWEIGDDGTAKVQAAKELTPSSAGVYTIPGAEILGKVTITVATEEDEKVTLTINKTANEDSAISSVSYSTTSATTGFKNATKGEDKWTTIALSPGTNVWVKVGLKSANYALSATFGDEAIEAVSGPTKSGSVTYFVYKVKTSGAKAVGLTALASKTITVKLDNANTIKDGKVTLTASADESDDIVATVGNNGTANIPEGYAVALSYELLSDENFGVDSIKVKAGSETADGAAAENEGTVTVEDLISEVEDDAVVTIKNKILAYPLTIENKTTGLSAVTVTNTDNTKTTADAAYAAVKSTEKAPKSWITGTTSGYLIYDEAGTVTVTVKAAAGYKPDAVTLTSKATKADADPAVANFVQQGEPTSAGVYTFKATGVTPKAYSNVISVTEQIVPATLSISYDDTLMDVKVVADKKEVTGVSGDYEIREGATASVTVTPKANVKITKAVKTIDGKDTNVSVKATGFTASIVMKEAVDLAVDAKAYLVLNQLKMGTTALAGGAKYVYKNVPYETELTASAMFGPAAATISGIELSVNDKKGTELDDGTAVDGNDITIGRKDAGRTITATVSFSETEETGVYTITTSAALEKISVSGVNKDGELTQQIGTTKTYTITSKSSGAALTGLEAVASDATNVSAVLSEDKKKLTVSIVGGTAGDGGTITLTDGEAEITEGGEITLKTTPAAVAAATTAPTVTQSGATDNSLILNLGLPAAVNSAMSSMVGGTALSYVISDLATNGEKGLVDGAIEIPVTGARQTETVKVLDVVSGEGVAQAVTFTVSLKQTVGTTDYETAAKYVFDATKVKTVFKTKDPAYASKLTVTKKATTVYAYDAYTEKNMKKQLNANGDLVLATIKADANATVLSYETSTIPVLTWDVTKNDNAGGYIESTEVATAVNANGELIIPKGETGLGKLLESEDDQFYLETSAVVTVIAKTPTNGEPVSVTVPVTVVPRAASVAVDDVKIYQKPTAATTVTLTPIYGFVTLAKNNAWVWSVDETAEGKGVKIASGKVTIPKGYDGTAITVGIASSYNADVKNDMTTITLTNEAVTPGTLVYGVAAEGTLTVLADSKTSITFGELTESCDVEGVGFYLLKKGAEATVTKEDGVTITTYDAEDIIEAADTKVTFTANNANVVSVVGATNAVGNNVIAGVIAPGTATITAVTEDTNTSVKMTLKVVNDTLPKTSYLTLATGDNVASNAKILSGEDEEAEKDFDKFYAKKQKLTKAELEGESDKIMALQVLTVSENAAGTNFEPEDIDSAYYGQKLTAVKDVVLLGEYPNAPYQTVYAVLPLAPTFQVKLGNVVYTVTDNAFDGIETEDTKTTQSGTVYTAANIAQDIVLKKTRTKTATESLNDSIDGVTFAPATITDTKASALAFLLSQAAENAVCGTAKDGSLTVSIPDVAMNTVPAGSYNLRVQYLMGGAPATKWQTVTIKVSAAPKFTPVLKYSSSYSFDGTDFALTGDPMTFEGKTDPRTYGGTITFVGVENVSTKGIYNHFQSVFQVSDAGVIALADGANLSAATAADLTGNIVYTVNGTTYRAKVTITLTTDEASFANMVAEWMSSEAAAEVDWSKNTTLASIQKLLAQSMAIPANIKIAAAPANKTNELTTLFDDSEVDVKAPNSKVDGITLKTRTNFDEADCVPTHLYQKVTTDEVGYVYGTMKISTTKAVNGGKANDATAIVYDFTIPMTD